MALGIGLLAWPSHARCGETPEFDFSKVLPDAQAPGAHSAVEQENWFPTFTDPATEPALHLNQKPLASRETEFSAPVAPLPPGVFAGCVGITVVAWAIHRVKKRGWV
jgi:hypothetical protein